MNLGLDMNVSSIIADIATIVVFLGFALICSKRGVCDKLVIMEVLP